MKKYRYIKSLCFLVILALAAGYAVHCYSIPKSFDSRGYEAFYKEPEDTIDGVVFGSSVVTNGWAAPVAWYEYGIPVYQLGGPIQPMGPLPELIEFVRSRQDIKYVIIDIHALRKEAIIDSVSPENALKASHFLHFGIHRYKVLSATLDYAEKIYDFYGLPENQQEILSKDDISNYIPFINLHNRWVDGLEKADYVAVPSEYKGAKDGKGAFLTKDVSNLIDSWENQPTEMDAFQKEILHVIFNYLQENNLDALFINYPSFYAEKESGQLKAIAQYIKDQGYDMLNLCSRETMEKAGLDPSQDFRDENHLNSRGSYKMTCYICSYIKEHHYYKDHRGERGYESWDKAAIDYNHFLKKGWAKKIPL